MKVKYANSKIKKSIFLAGPTPRSEDVPSWRPEAIQILKELGFKGTVYVPETKDGIWKHNYDEQIFWEWEALNQATTVVFWVPRELTNMPAFTTNVEFGMFANSSKVLYGRPEGAPKMKYLDALAGRYGIPIYDNLHKLLDDAYSFTIYPYGA